MSQSSDDDMPPPLEDMTEQIKINKEKKEAALGSFYGGSKKSEDHVEEIRLAPKKNSRAPASPKPSGLAPKDDDYDFDSKGKVSEPKPQAASAPKEAQPAKPAPAQKKQQKNSGFGGFAAGFLNA